MTDKETLIEAKKLIENGWTQGAAARSKDGISVYGGSGEAVQFCTQGALARASNYESIRRIITFFEYLNNIKDIVDWNDSPERTKEQVLEAFNKAIAFI